MTVSFNERANRRWGLGRHVCVGLDVDLNRIPRHINGDPPVRVMKFLQAIIDATATTAGAYKPNLAFFEALGGQASFILADAIRYIRSVAPDVPVIVDAKRADIAHTNNGTIEHIFGFLEADAVTVHPYLGQEALRPFLEREDKGIFVLCRTSNPGAGELQDLQVVGGEPLFLHLAGRIASDWNYNNNCGLVAGATYPEELRLIRQRTGSLPILIPGVGAQGGDLEATVRAASQGDELRAFINASRSVIYASADEEFAEAASQELGSMNTEIHRVLANLTD